MKRTTYNDFSRKVILARNSICFALAIRLSGITCQALASDIMREQGATFVFYSDEPPAEAIPKNLLGECRGVEIIPQGFSGNALQLKPLMWAITLSRRQLYAEGAESPNSSSIYLYPCEDAKAIERPVFLPQPIFTIRPEHGEWD